MSDAPARPTALPRRHGLTLLEIMVVLVIVGILSGIAYIKFESFQRQAELRASSQKLVQILSWARLESEKRGDTLLIQFALPQIRVYADLGGNGIVDASDPRLLLDSLSRTVRLFKPSATPPPAPAAVPTNGLAAGTGTCGAGVCCEANRSSGSPSWLVAANTGVALCARNMPRMPSILEEGAIYLESNNSKVKEKWAVVMASATSANPTLWTAGTAPALRTEWRQAR